MIFQLRHVSMPGMPRVAASFTLSDEERKVLLQWSRGRRTPARLVRRARIVLRAADGWLNTTIARRTWESGRRPWGSGGGGLPRSGRPESRRTRRAGGARRRSSMARSKPRSSVRRHGSGHRPRRIGARGPWRPSCALVPPASGVSGNAMDSSRTWSVLQAQQRPTLRGEA